MPRRKLDPAAEVLNYFLTTPYDVASVVFGLVKSQMAKRAPQPEPKMKTRRVKKTPPPVPSAQAAVEAVTQTPPMPTPAKPVRRRRLRADSARPANEATPIVPRQEEVGGDEAYTGD